MADATRPANWAYTDWGNGAIVIPSGGAISVESGGAINLASGATQTDAGTHNFSGAVNISGASAFSAQLNQTSTSNFSGNTTLGNVTVLDAKNFAFGTSTGTILGTATSQKIGLWGATPVIQPSGAAQGALTNSTGGAANGTMVAIGNTAAASEATNINKNFTEIYTLLNALRAAALAAGLIKGGA